MPSSIVSPFPFFTDASGAPLEAGYIYIGQSNLNPETAPVNVFWDLALTIPAGQPIRTVGGYPSRAGSPSRFYVSNDTYSITVRNRNHALVFSAFDQSDAPTSVFDVSTQLITATAGQLTFTLTMFTYLPGTDTLEVYRNGLRLNLGLDYLETNSSTVTLTTAAAAGDQFLFQGGSVVSGNQVPGSQVSFIQAGTGAVTRNIQDKARESVSVKDFGAVGDGVTDDTAAIQAAINSIPSLGYGDIVFPKANYVINGTLIFNQRFISFVFDVGAVLSGSGTVNGYTLATTNWKFTRRIHDRLYVGRLLDANDGTLWTNGPNSWSKDWLEIELNTASGGASAVAQCVSFSDTGYIALLGASKTSDNPLLSSEGTMGVAGFALADKIPTAGNQSTAYAFYAEARRKGNAGWCHTCEFDAIARSATGTGSAPAPALLVPGNPFHTASLTGAWFSNSRPDISDGGDIAVGLAFVNNAGTRTGTQGRNKIGILFDQKSVLGADNTNYASASNIGQAIALGNGHAIGWWNESATTAPTDFVYGGTNVLYFGNSRGTTFAATNDAGTNVNYLYAIGSNSGSAPALSVASPDASCDLRLSPKSVSGAVTAYADNLTSLGKSGNRWSSVWAANGTIQTSDERSKHKIEDSVLGLAFINLLKPVSYQFKVGGNEILESDPQTGLPTKIQPVPGKRTHFGLLAQQVKQVLPENVDFGGWIKTDPTDAQSEEGLRYEEFIAPIIKAVQELSAEVEKLKLK